MFLKNRLLRLVPYRTILRVSGQGFQSLGSTSCEIQVRGRKLCTRFTPGPSTPENPKANETEEVLHLAPPLYPAYRSLVVPILGSNGIWPDPGKGDRCSRRSSCKENLQLVDGPRRRTFFFPYPSREKSCQCAGRGGTGDPVEGIHTGT